MDNVVGLLNAVQIHLAVAKQGLDKGDRFFIAIDPPKLTCRVFKVHILRINAVCLVSRKPLIVVFENLKNRHKWGVGHWASEEIKEAKSQQSKTFLALTPHSSLLTSNRRSASACGRTLAKNLRGASG